MLESDGSVGVRSAVDRAYDAIKVLVVNLELRPGERLNEAEMARRLSVSRTPLREALNRLSSEGFIESTSGRGFRCREVDPRQIYELFALRSIIEAGAIRIGIERASNAEITAIADYVEASNAERSYTRSELIQLDETFHEKLVALSGNREFLTVIRNINERIRLVRCFEIEKHRPRLEDEHRAIARALYSRNAQTCIELLEQHIERRVDLIAEALRDAIGRMYAFAPAANER